jgi:ABC-type nitrate/sulfonate/bicarbonate transport system ATPase subunit
MERRCVSVQANGAGKPLTIRDLSMTYLAVSGERVEALAPLDLDVRAGEFVVIVGPSGCGKTTLLQILAGFFKPSGGEARVGDARIEGPDIDRGMVFQSYALFPWLTVAGNVEFGLERKGIAKRERREIARGYLKMVGLQEFANKQVNEMSGGMKQRVAIARAFATEPSIILMDEPFGALDALTRRFLQRELLRIWQEHKKTVVFITHSVVEALSLGDRILVMTARPGRIKRELLVQHPHPRDLSSELFRQYERDIYAELDEELAKSFDLMGQTGG